MHRAIPAGIAADRAALERMHDRFVQMGVRFGAQQSAGISQAQLHLVHIGKTMCDPAERAISIAAARLNDLSPLAILGRGYAIARDGEGHVVKTVGQVASGDEIDVAVSDGSISCTVN
jgi:exodeoxyribonuclease VII large subunit